MTFRHELSRQQLRALLLLLILLPLTPTVLMFRFMVEALRNEHVAGEERLGSIYRQALSTATNSLRNHLASHGLPQRVKVADLGQFYRRAFDSAVRVQIVGSNGRALAGDAHDATGAIAEDSLGEMLPGARVRIFPAVSSDAVLVDEQINTYGWAVAGVVLVNILVSGAAALALHRQSRLRELQSSALATVAHELKTPLAAMRVLTDTLLGMDAPDPERCRTYLQMIAGENERLIRLTENFLILSRFESRSGVSHREAVEPVLLARAALDSLATRFREAQIQPDINFAKNLPTVLVNRESMVVVLINLLDNAFKFSEPGQPIALQLGASGQTVQFLVRDHGIGIPAEAQPRIFECFFQADQKLARTREGCGLGLHIARTIVEAHGGTIAVRSAPGSGSTFCVSLPAANKA